MDNNKLENKWYTITTISGKEDTVIQSLKNRAVSEGIQDVFEDYKVFLVPYLSPKEEAKRIRGEKFTPKHKNLYPGYIFVKMNMTNEAWFLVRNTQYVTGLVGSSGQRAKPTPISDDKIIEMELKVKNMILDFEGGKIKTRFAPNKIVEVIDGPAKGQIGKILENDDERQKALVEIIMFGRKTPTEISYKDIKIKN